MSVIAKFTVTRIEHTTYEGGFKSTKVHLEPRYEKTLPEDQRFHEATPSGSMVLDVSNQKALEQFVVGKAFYVTFEDVPEGVGAYHS